MEKTSLDFGIIQKPLDSVLLALEFKVEREWPKQYAGVPGARDTVLILLKLARNTYRTILYFVADDPPDPFRRPSYVLSVPPLNRTILDSIFSLVFMLENFAERAIWYQKAGWRELHNQFVRDDSAYGHLPEWQEWITKLKEMLAGSVSLIGIDAAEVADPAKIPRWPLPSRMIWYPYRHPRIPVGPLSHDRAYLAYLEDWFYRDLSSMSHVSSFAAFQLGPVLLSAMMPEDFQHNVDENMLPAMHGFNVGRAVTLMLALASEVEMFFRFGLADRLKFVWTVLGDYSLEPKEVYEFRYRDWL